jgi:hypothetical protein
MTGHDRTLLTLAATQMATVAAAAAPRPIHRHRRRWRWTLPAHPRLGGGLGRPRSIRGVRTAMSRASDRCGRAPFMARRACRLSPSGLAPMARASVISSCAAPCYFESDSNVLQGPPGAANWHLAPAGLAWPRNWSLELRGQFKNRNRNDGCTWMRWQRMVGDENLSAGGSSAPGRKPGPGSAEETVMALHRHGGGWRAMPVRFMMP